VATLESEALRVSVDPTRGARVLSLLDIPRGREWLVPPLNTALPQFGSPTASLMTGGWDECFPSIAEGAHPVLDGVRLVDHGELWSRAWKVLHSSRAELRTSIQGVELPYLFERKIRIEGATLHAQYSVRNEGDQPYAAMWAMHPVFAATREDEVILDTHKLTCDSSFPSGLVPMGERIPWPLQLEREIDFALKLYSERFRSRSAAIIDGRSEAWVAMRFDTPYVGVWLNYRGLPVAGRAAEHVALEPSLGSSDDLAKAFQADPELVLGSGQVRRWGVSMTVGAGREQLDSSSSARCALTRR
jgi:hypothetical protein